MISPEKAVAKKSRQKNFAREELKNNGPRITPIARIKGLLSSLDP
jgi:hypothetical protein